MNKIDLTSDTGKFRAAMLLSGFFPEAECVMFNDKGQGTRRLKLWRAGAVAAASKNQIALLLGWLSMFFGERFIEHGFRNSGRWMHNQESFYIRLST
jgi:hypothetical protein